MKCVIATRYHILLQGQDVLEKGQGLRNKAKRIAVATSREVIKNIPKVICAIAPPSGQHQLLIESFYMHFHNN